MGTKHTPTPWKIAGATHIYAPGSLVCSVCEPRPEGITDVRYVPAEFGSEEAFANAHFIVKAANNHDALVSALRDLAEAARNACNAEQHPALTNALFEADQIIKAAE